jgi:heme-degrading monooxygenase HmoA
MRDETKPGPESHKHASSVTKRATDLPEERDNNTLTLTPGNLLTGLSVFQIDQPHQQTLIHGAMASAREVGSEEGIQSSAIFRGTGGSDVAIFTQWMNRRAYDQAPQMLLKPPEQDLYQIVIVDHITGQGASHLAIEEGLFHFINVFPLAPGKRDDVIDFFEHTIRIVRVQPGYVSTNLQLSLDDRHAVNIGQFKTRQDFLAMTRRPRVLMAFAQGLRRRIVRRPPRLRQYDLLAVSLYHAIQSGERS